jgi:MFS family permease
MISDLGITRSRIALLYLFATVASSTMLPLVGKLVDRVGARVAVGFVAGGLGAACMFTSAANSSLALLVSFWALRFFGQGSMMLVAQYVINQWWVERRGLAMGIGGSLMSLGMLGLVAPCTRLTVAHDGWRASYRRMAYVELLVMLPIGLVFYRAAPEVFGLLPDGRGAVAAREVARDADVEIELGARHVAPESGQFRARARTSDEEAGANDEAEGAKEEEEGADLICDGPADESVDGDIDVGAACSANAPALVATTDAGVGDTEAEGASFTASEALRTGAFWSIAAGTSLMAASATAYFFHMNAMCAEAGLSKGVVDSAYPLYAVASVVARLAGGWAIDKREPRTILLAALATHSVALGGCAALLSGVGSSAAPLLLWGSGLCMAISLALMNNTAGVAYAQFFGRAHLGAIGGLANALVVLGSALGPFPFGYAKDATGSFRTAYAVAAALPLVVGALVVLKGARPTHAAPLPASVPRGGASSRRSAPREPRADGAHA